MYSQKIDELTDQLLAAERSLELVRSEIGLLRDAVRHTRRARAFAICMSIAATIAVASFGQWSVARADGQSVTLPFTVFNSAHKKVMEVRDTYGNNELILFDQNGKPSAGLVSLAQGGTVVVTNPAGASIAGFGVGENGDGELEIYDHNSRPIANILRGTKGGQGLALFDMDGNQRIRLFTGNDKGSILLAQSSDPSEPDKAAVFLHADNNSSYLGATDPSSHPLAMLGTSSAAPCSDPSARCALVVFSPEGDHLIEAYQNRDGNGSVKAMAKSDPKLWSAVGVAEKGPGFAINQGENILGTFMLSDGKPELNIFNTAGRAIASLKEESDGKGVVAAYNNAGTPVAFLVSKDNGGGNVTVADSTGSGVFAASAVGAGTGNACIDVPKVGLKCFGIGLPMTMSVSK